MSVYAEGPNYRIIEEDGFVTCQVWSRPDLSSEEGAACAEEKIQHFHALAQRLSVRAMFLDLEQAPPVTGPRTQRALGELLKPFEALGKPIAVLVGPSATQQMQLRRLIEEHASVHGFLLESRDAVDGRLRGTFADR